VLWGYIIIEKRPLALKISCKKAGLTMGLLQKEKNRNAAKARNSFVTRKVEKKLTYLADVFKSNAGAYFSEVEKGVLTRTLKFKGFGYLDNLKLVYNWENRFFSVNYNLQLLSEIAVNEKFEEIGDCHFEAVFRMKGSKWECKEWTNKDNNAMKDQYLKRLNNPLIMKRLSDLDIVDFEIKHKEGAGTFTISCESMIGSATWIFIPPVTNLITPTPAECIKFYELFELLGDALVNNKI